MQYSQHARVRAHERAGVNVGTIARLIKQGKAVELDVDNIKVYLVEVDRKFYIVPTDPRNTVATTVLELEQWERSHGPVAQARKQLLDRSYSPSKGFTIEELAGVNRSKLYKP